MRRHEDGQLRVRYRHASIVKKAFDIKAGIVITHVPDLLYTSALDLTSGTIDSGTDASPGFLDHGWQRQQRNKISRYT